MKIIGVIPARYGSTRFPGKPLTTILGKPMIRLVWENSIKSKELENVIIATDDKRIYQVAKSFNADVLMTPKDCKSGTDRLAFVAKKLGNKTSIMVNIQGDEPLIDPLLIDNLVKVLKNNNSVSVATAIFPIKDNEELSNINIVKVVKTIDDYAIYFSRYPIPYNRDSDKKVVYYKHLGIYAYKTDFLLDYTSWRKTPLEKAEMLEQLRILEHGYKIKLIVSQKDSVGVDTPEDVGKIERILKSNIYI